MTTRLDTATPPVDLHQYWTEIPVTGETNACRPQPVRGIGIVYRDFAGKVVGGAFGTNQDITTTTGFADCVAGGFRGGVYAYSPFPARARRLLTEAQVYCDVPG